VMIVWCVLKQERRQYNICIIVARHEFGIRI
jgi:hypothetical protein